MVSNFRIIRFYICSISSRQTNNRQKKSFALLINFASLFKRTMKEKETLNDSTYEAQLLSRAKTNTRPQPPCLQSLYQLYSSLPTLVTYITRWFYGEWVNQDSLALHLLLVLYIAIVSICHLIWDKNFMRVHADLTKLTLGEILCEGNSEKNFCADLHLKCDNSYSRVFN